MPETPLLTAIQELADASHEYSDVDMAQPFHWRKHGEGVRLANVPNWPGAASIYASTCPAAGKI